MAALVSVWDVADILEPFAEEPGGRDWGAHSALAVDNHRLVGIEFTDSAGEFGERDVGHVFEVSESEFGTSADIEDGGVRLGLELDCFGAGDFGEGELFAVAEDVRADPAHHLVETDESEIASGEACGFGVIGDEEDRGVVGEERTGKVHEAFVQGERNAAGEVCIRELFDGAEIHHLDVLGELIEGIDAESSGGGEHGWAGEAVLVAHLHLGEVARGLGLSAEDFIHELVFGLDFEAPVDLLFESESADGHTAEALAAGATGAVGGVDQEVIRHRFEELGKAAVEHLCSGFHGAFESGGPFEEVGAADVADEDEVTGEGDDGFGAGGFIGEDEGDVLRRVTRGVPDIETQVTDADDIAMLDEGDVRFVGVAVLPVGGAFIGEEEPGAGALGEFPGAGEEVGVDVGFGDDGDGESLAAGVLEDGLEVLAGIDDGGVTGSGTTDEVGGVSERLVVEAFDDHDDFSFWLVLNLGWARRGGGCGLVPGHFCEEAGHSADVGETGEGEAGADEGGDVDAPGGAGEGEDGADEDEGSGGETDLALDGPARGLAGDNLIACALPGGGTAFENEELIVVRSEDIAAHGGAATGLAEDDELFVAVEVGEAALELFEGDVDGTGDVASSEFAGAADVNQLEVFADFDAALEI